MDTEGHLRAAEDMLRPWSTDIVRAGTGRLDVYLSVRDLLAAVEALHLGHMGYLAAITGLDRLSSDDRGRSDRTIEVLYHFAKDAAVVTLRVAVPYDGAAVPSVCGLIPSATLYERELMEMFGVDVQGTPSRDRLVLADDWPEGVYPLRKSFQGLTSAGEE